MNQPPFNPPGPPYPQQPGQPYPGQPGQPYPQQPYPQQPGTYGAPPPRKSRKGLWIGIALAAVLLVGALVAIGVVAVTIGNSSDLEAGKCVEFSSLSQNAADSKYEIKDCSDDAATFEVASKTEGTATCNENDLTYTLVEKNDTAKVQETVCMVPNLKEGKCYVHQDDGRFVVSGCEAADAAKVVKRVDGKADESLCAEYPPDSAVTYQKPARTYCAVIGG
mgnify:CR=1 FL=1